MLEILLGQIPEAIYFALFMIFTKQLKEKRILFMTFMIIDYLLLKYFISYDVYFQISYTVIVFIILKVLYKEKSQITDIFTFSIASIILILSCIVLYFIVWKTIDNFIIYVILNRLFLALFLIFARNKLKDIQKIYKKLWNRNDNINKKIKSTTFRALNVVVFNILFYFINLGMIFTLILGRSV